MMITELFEILQLKTNKNYRHIRFMSYETAINNKPDLSINDYNIVYNGDIEVDSTSMETNDILDKLFHIFNVEKPKDFRGHSLSISDIIKIGKDYYYIDSFGFTKLDNTFIDGGI